MPVSVYVSTKILMKQCQIGNIKYKVVGWLHPREIIEDHIYEKKLRKYELTLDEY